MSQIALRIAIRTNSDRRLDLAGATASSRRDVSSSSSISTLFTWRRIWSSAAEIHGLAVLLLRGSSPHRVLVDRLRRPQNAPLHSAREHDRLAADVPRGDGRREP